MDEHRAVSGTRPPARYLLLVGTLLATFMVVFLLVGALSVPVLHDPTRWLAHGTAVDAIIGTSLLVADVVLPMPASLIMFMHGTLFGVAGGTALSIAGSVGATMLGYGLGRWTGPSALRASCSPAERERAHRFVHRWGALAVAASRPVPLLAETVAVAAGASSLGVARTIGSATLGSVPAAALYAAAGAASLDAPNGLAVLAIVLALAAVLWLVGRRYDPVMRHERHRHPTTRDESR